MGENKGKEPIRNFDTGKISPDGIDLFQQFRSTLTAVKSVFDQSVELSQARLLMFQEVQGDKEVSQSEIHQKMGVDPAIVTRILKQMEADGQVSRRPDPADNRYTLVRLTELGERQYQEMMVKAVNIGTLLLQGLNTEEIHSLQTYLQRIQKNAETQVRRSVNTAPNGSRREGGMEHRTVS